MPKTRIVTKRRKEPLSTLLKRAGKDKFIVASIAFIIVGLLLITYSYTFTDVVVTPNTTSFHRTANNQSIDTFVFTQPHNLSGKITFRIPGQDSVHYELSKYYHVQTRGILINQYSLVKQGNATNSDIIQPHLSPSGTDLCT